MPDRREMVLEKIRQRNPELAAQLEADPGLAKSLAQKEIAQRKQQFPCKDFVPNWGQERYLECLRRPHENYGDYPHGLIVPGGNGSGKTGGAFGSIFPGVCLGKAYLNEQWFGDFEFFDMFERMREERVVYIRIVCDKADVKPDGSVYQQIKKWCPLAEFGGMEGGHYTWVKMPNPDPEKFYDVSVGIITHGQPITASAGPDIDLLIFNEPPPFDTWQENISRLRTGGRYMAFLTPLHMASFLYGVIHGDHPDGEIVHCKISIWDNCVDRRGILTREAIERQIRDWESTKPLELPARVDGEFAFLIGAVFPIFRQSEHVIPESEALTVRPNWNWYHGCDPHPVKPHVGLWVANDATNTVRVMAEYPQEPWENLARNFLGIPQFGSEFDRIESGRHPRFPFGRRIRVLDSIGDPNAMACRAVGAAKATATIASEYDEKCGRTYNLGAPDSVELRHEMITQMLYWDRGRPLGPTNAPRLLVSPRCRNMIKAIEQYMFKSQIDQGEGSGLSDKVEPKWECWIACLGYILLVMPQWSPIANDGGDSDYEEYLRGTSRNHDYDDDVPAGAGRLSCLCHY